MSRAGPRSTSASSLSAPSEPGTSASCVGRLRAAERLAVHARTGHASLREYAERILGLTGRQLEERLRVARALGELPLLDQSLASGELCWSAVRELSRIATPQTEQTWLGWAKGRRSQPNRAGRGRPPPGGRTARPPRPLARQAPAPIRGPAGDHGAVSRFAVADTSRPRRSGGRRRASVRDCPPGARRAWASGRGQVELPSGGDALLRVWPDERGCGRTELPGRRDRGRDGGL